MPITSRMCLEHGISWNSLMNTIFRAEDAAQANDIGKTREMLNTAKKSADWISGYFPPSKPIASEVGRMIGKVSAKLGKKGTDDAELKAALREIRYKALDIYVEAKKSCADGPVRRKRSPKR